MPPGDSTALARTVLELLGDPDRARALGAGGREVIRRDYHPDTEARRLADVYAQALEPAGTAARPSRPAAAV